MLWSGILLLWDILGIDLALARSTEGSIGPIITAIKNPAAMPWVLLSLIIYFIFKLIIEWGQCSEYRRANRVSVLDFSAAFAAAAVATLFFFVNIG